MTYTKAIAIPVRLLKENLTPEEQFELEQLQNQSLSDEEIAQRQQEKIDHETKLALAEANKYKFERRIEYDKIGFGDQLDEIWKALKMISENGVQLPEGTLNMIEKITEIKEKYPKP